MAAKLERTRTPGIYRRNDRYVVVWRHRGKQYKSFHRTYEEAREAKGRRQAGDSRPASRDPFDDYAREWIENFGGRTDRGISPAGQSARPRKRSGLRDSHRQPAL